MVDDANWQGVGVFTLDLRTNTILGYLNLNARPDHVSMSPTGTYCVVSWLDDTSVFNRDMTNKRMIFASSQHSDIALAANGDDVFVAVDYSSNNGEFFMTNLRTLTRTSLFNTYFGDGSALAYHVSGKAFNYPGWVLVSTYASSGPRHWNHEKLFVVELASNPKVYQLAHHQSLYVDYFTAPRASVNRNLTLVAFTSNWRVNTASDLDTYVIELPTNAFSANPPAPTAAPVAAPVTIVQDTFGNSLAGRVPDSLSVNRNPWIVTLGTMYVANGVLSSSVAHRAVVEAGTASVSVSAVVTFTSTGDAGLLFRYVDANNFFILRVQATGWVVRRNLNGVVSNLASGDLGLAVGGSHTIKVNAKGSALDFYVNGVKVKSLTDSNLLTGVKHGVIGSTMQTCTYDTFTIQRI